jgi:hypothetical protein
MDYAIKAIYCRYEKKDASIHVWAIQQQLILWGILYPKDEKTAMFMQTKRGKSTGTQFKNTN